MEPILEVTQLKKHFPLYAGILRQHVATNYAVDGIDFVLYPGEVLGLVGESGSGKSTAARAACRLIDPTSGTVCFDGKNLSDLSRNALLSLRREIQVVFQDPYNSLNPRRSIGESIGEALLYHQLVPNREAMEQEVANILQQIGLQSDVMHRYPHEFSGGQLQRICIGRAIALKPRLLILDEAVSALDLSVRSQILNLLNDLKAKYNLSYLFITHDMSVVRHFCNRVVVMYLGHVMETAPCEALFTSPRHPYTHALLSAIPKDHPRDDKKRFPLTGEIPSSLHPPSGCPFRTRCPYATAACAQSIPLKTAQGHSWSCIYEQLPKKV